MRTREFHCHSHSRAARAGFTLLEILVAVGIIAILAAIVVPISKGVDSRGKAAKCASNLRQLAAATGMFTRDNAGQIPNYYTSKTADEAPAAPASAGGQWYWHLSPYVEVPRWNAPSGMNLGPDKKGLDGPVIFTCPGNTTKEANAAYLKYPSSRPVSYAPSMYVKGTNKAWDDAVGLFVYTLNINDVVDPASKIWLSDSAVAGTFNTSSHRWTRNTADNWAYQSFTRHSGSGNALFFDGHVESFPIEHFTKNYSETTIRRYFDPTYVAP